MSKEQFMTPATNNKPGQLVEMETGTDEVLFLEPSTFDKDGKLIPGRVHRAEHVADDDVSDEDEVYVAPVSYFEEARQRTTAASNSFSDQIEELRQNVLKAMGDVNRTREGSPEHARAESKLVYAKDALRGALRRAQSELLEEKAVATTTAERISEIDGELAAIRDVLDAIEPNEQGVVKTNHAENNKRKTVMVLQRAAQLLGEP